MENMSSPLEGSRKSNEMYNIKSTMHGFRERFFLSQCDAPVIDILSIHTIVHQLSVFRLIIQSLSHRMPSTHIVMSLHKQCIIIMIGIINTKFFMKTNIITFDTSRPSVDLADFYILENISPEIRLVSFK